MMRPLRKLAPELAALLDGCLVEGAGLWDYGPTQVRGLLDPTRPDNFWPMLCLDGTYFASYESAMRRQSLPRSIS